MTKKEIEEKAEESATDKATSFTCDECGETFSSEQELREHTYYH
jgi:formylmethanofuran dehydrogenase subunit E